jgi:hypothetical protein
MIAQNKLLVCLMVSIIMGLVGWTSGCTSPTPTTTTTPTATTPVATTPSVTTPAVTTVSFAKEILPIFSAGCVGCHQGSPGPAGLSLESVVAYNNLVNVKSTESALMRVAPGAPDKSYLLNKLLGTQAQAGGKGAQMPFNAPPLSQTQIELLQKWISAGAANN